MQERTPAVSKVSRWIEAIFYSPVLWGGAATVLFYTPIEAGHWNDPFVVRYFAGHWVEYVTTALFFVGLSALVIKALRIKQQFTIFGQPLLDATVSGGQPVGHAAALLAR